LVARLLKHVPELKRLRLSSIDSIEADETLLRLIAEDERLMPHFHLSAQSGDNLILKRMKRRHTREDTIRFCDTVRRLRPDAAFGADLIAAFLTSMSSRSAPERERRLRACRSFLACSSKSARAACAKKASTRWRPGFQPLLEASRSCSWKSPAAAAHPVSRWLHAMMPQSRAASSAPALKRAMAVS
jgi:hypothetical protein